MAYETFGGQLIDGSNAVFTATYDITNEQLFVDRSLQVNGTDYSVSNNTITFLAGAIPQAGALLCIYYLPAGAAATHSNARYDTAGDIINDVAAEIGLGSSADPYASTDSNFIQLRALLKSVGRRLTFENDWSHLRGEYVATTSSGQSQYGLPPDWNNMIDQTGWNRTNRLPIGGPLSPQEWQFFKSRLSGVVFNVLFRQMQGRWNLYPDTSTPAGYQIACEYNSRWWVGGSVDPAPPNRATPADYDPNHKNGAGYPAGDAVIYPIAGNDVWMYTVTVPSNTVPSAANATYMGTISDYTGDWAAGIVIAAGDYKYSAGECYIALTAGTTSATATSGPVGFGSVLDGSVIWKWCDPFGFTTTDAPTASDDTIWFDSTLVSRALKLAFLEAKGFPADAAKREFDQVFNSVVDSDRPSPILNLRGRSPFDPLLGIQNIPIVGYGQ